MKKFLVLFGFLINVVSIYSQSDEIFHGIMLGMSVEEVKITKNVETIYYWEYIKTNNIFLWGRENFDFLSYWTGTDYWFLNNKLIGLNSIIEVDYLREEYSQYNYYLEKYNEIKMIINSIFGNPIENDYQLLDSETFKQIPNIIISTIFEEYAYVKNIYISYWENNSEHIYLVLKGFYNGRYQIEINYGNDYYFNDFIIMIREELYDDYIE
jgi:hypothetical protein